MDAAFEFAGMLYPGTYRVSVSRGSSVSTSNLPLDGIHRQRLPHCLGRSHGPGL